MFLDSIRIIQIRPPQDFGPKAQNLEGVRICLRICGMEIISWKNQKKYFVVISDKNGQNGPPR